MSSEWLGVGLGSRCRCLLGWFTTWNDGHAFALSASLSNANAKARTWMWSHATVVGRP